MLAYSATRAIFSFPDTGLALRICFKNLLGTESYTEAATFAPDVFNHRFG
jgi:hypothetical protein